VAHVNHVPPIGPDRAARKPQQLYSEIVKSPNRTTIATPTTAPLVERVPHGVPPEPPDIKRSQSVITKKSKSSSSSSSSEDPSPVRYSKLIKVPPKKADIVGFRELCVNKGADLSCLVVGDKFSTGWCGKKLLDGPKKSFWVVWRGIKVGIFGDEGSFLKVTKGFSGAQHVRLRGVTEYEALLLFMRQWGVIKN